MIALAILVGAGLLFKGFLLFIRHCDFLPGAGHPWLIDFGKWSPAIGRCECIGRYTKTGRAAIGGDKNGKPCDYAGYGLFKVSPVRVKMFTHPPGGARVETEIHCFAFADACKEPTA